MLTILNLLKHFLEFFATILLAYISLTYSKGAREKYKILSLADGKKHIFLFLIVIFLGVRTSIDYFTDSVEKNLLRTQFLSGSALLFTQLADRALWEGTKECGDRTIYEDLRKSLNQKEIPEVRKVITVQVERIENDYKDSILAPRVDAIPAVCQQGTMQGASCRIEPVEGFLAKNVVEHLEVGKYHRCTSRARAAGILRNIKTAVDKDEIDMTKLLETLVFIMRNDPSLLVSKLALDRYSQFTGFLPSNVFDFEAAIDDFEMRIKQRQPLLLSDYSFRQ